MSPFGSKKVKGSPVRFNLENHHFRNLHLLLYLASLVVVLVVYTFVLLVLGKNQYSYTVMVVFSVCVGVFLVFRKDEMVKRLSNEMDKRKRFEIKKRDSINLKKTLSEVGVERLRRRRRKIEEKNKNLKFKISQKKSFKEVLRGISGKKRKETERKGPEYIEIK